MRPYLRLLPTVAALGLAVGACSGSPPADSPATTPAATLTPSPALVPTATATARPATPTPTLATPTAAPPSAIASTPTAASASPTGEPLAIEGRIVDEEHGYAVTLPEGWMRIDLEGEFLDAVVEMMGDDADVQAMLALMEQLEGMSGAGISLFAFRLDGIDDEFATNVNVITLPTMGLSLDALERLNVSQLENAEGIANVRSERVDLPAAEALYMTYDMETLNASGSETIEAVVHQYLIVGDGRQYVLTVSGFADDQLDADAEEMAESFELLGGD